MVAVIEIDEVERLLRDEGAQLVEVLPAAEYEEEHLPGALSIPLKELGGRARAALDPAVPVVVYCWDWLCDMSPRAAARLAALGFVRVYDYAPGKVDWMASAGAPRRVSAGRRASATSPSARSPLARSARVSTRPARASATDPGGSSTTSACCWAG